MEAVRQHMAAPESASPVRVAYDVRRLIEQAEGGDVLDAEWTGHAYDVAQDVAASLAPRLGAGGDGLVAEMDGRIDRFARTSATTAMYMRLVVTDTLPDLPDYAPCQVSVFDGVRTGGTDFSKVIQRSTIYGTVMTSVNVTDLKAYFESGRKRHLLVYMGTDRNADMKALDRMMTALPALLAAAGMDAGTIKTVVDALRAGALPPAALKLVMQLVELGQLRLTQVAGQALTPAEQVRLEKLETTTKALLADPATMRGLSPVIVTALHALDRAQTVLKALPSVMQAAGVDAASLKTLVEALRAGNLPPAALNLFSQMVELGQARLAQASGLKLTKSELGRLEKLDMSVKALLADPQLRASVAPVFVHVAGSVAKAPMRGLPPAGFRGIQTPHNDNRAESVKTLVAALRAAVRDGAVPPAQRADVARVLRDVRQDQASRQTAGLVRLDAVIRTLVLPQNAGRVPVAPVDAGFIARVLPAFTPVMRTVSAAVPLHAVTLAQATLAVMDAVVRQTGMPPAQQDGLSRQADRLRVDIAKPHIGAEDLAQAVLSSLRPMLLTGVVQNPQLLRVLEAVEPAARAIVSSASGPQYNPDGTLKDCCRAAFGQAVALESLKPDTARMDQGWKETVEQKTDGALVFVAADGKRTEYTGAQVADNIKGHEALDAELARAAPAPTRAEAVQAQKWADETAKMLEGKGESVKQKFIHAHGPGCGCGQHGGFAATPVEPTGTVVTQRADDLKIVKVALTDEPKTGARPRRTMRPA